MVFLAVNGLYTYAIVMNVKYVHKSHWHLATQQHLNNKVKWEFNYIAPVYVHTVK